MPLIDEASAKMLKEKFEKSMKDPVEVLFFASRADVPAERREFIEFTESFLKELAALEPRITFRELGMSDDLAKKHAVTTVPSLMVGEDKGYDIIFNGAPAGYEVTSLIESVILVSRAENTLSPESSLKLGSMTKPVRLRVFVTPTCPYCPQSVLLAVRMAVAAKGMVTAECVEAQENIELSQKYNVSGVPQQVVNDDPASVTVGVQTEDQFVDQTARYGK